MVVPPGRGPAAKDTGPAGGEDTAATKEIPPSIFLVILQTNRATRKVQSGTSVEVSVHLQAAPRIP